MRDKIKNFVIGALFAIIVGLGILYYSGEPVKAGSTYVGNTSVTYDVVNVNGHSIAIFKCGSDIEVVRL